MFDITTHRDSTTGTVTIAPKNEQKQSALVVICHGLGDTSEGFVDVAENLASQMPHVKFILPTAPTQRVTMYMGTQMPSWYDIVGLDERSNETCPGIEESQKKLASILQSEHEKTGIPYSRMVLAGFSQGGALSLFTGMQLRSKSCSSSNPALDHQLRLGGILIMSGYLPCAAKFTISPGLEETPILHLHGKLDPLVKYQSAERSRDFVTSKGGVKYVLKGFEGLQHSVNMDVLNEAASYLRRLLPEDASFQIKLKDPSEMSIKELREVIQKAGLSHQTVGFMERADFVRLVQEYRNGKV